MCCVCLFLFFGICLSVCLVIFVCFQLGSLGCFFCYCILGRGGQGVCFRQCDLSEVIIICIAGFAAVLIPLAVIALYSRRYDTRQCTQKPRLHSRLPVRCFKCDMSCKQVLSFVYSCFRPTDYFAYSTQYRKKIFIPVFIPREHSFLYIYLFIQPIHSTKLILLFIIFSFIYLFTNLIHS